MRQRAIKELVRDWRELAERLRADAREMREGSPARDRIEGMAEGVECSADDLETRAGLKRARPVG